MHNFDSVIELTNHASLVVDGDFLLNSLSVKGELSGVKIYTKRGRYGQIFHTVYFKLKDTSASIDGIMFLESLDQLGFDLEDGKEVVCCGSCSIYPPTGSFRLKASTMRLNGVGDIEEQMRRLYEKLNREGLFAPEHKKQIPLLPKRIGVITSAEGLVIHDIITTLNERNTHYDILIYPARTSGEGCPEQIIQGLQWFSDQHNVDVIIIARGGGHPEEFVGFNTESLARAIYDCDIPVISAVGHEKDYTICDYVADLRALTPTAAGMVVIGDYVQLSDKLSSKKDSLDFAFESYINRKRNQLDRLSQSKALYSPMFYVSSLRNNLSNLKSRLAIDGASLVSSEKSKLDELRNSLQHTTDMYIQKEKYKLSGYIDNLDLLGPINVLKRGYSYVTTNDKTLTSVKDTEVGTKVNIVFADGNADAEIIRVNKEAK